MSTSSDSTTSSSHHHIKNKFKDIFPVNVTVYGKKKEYCGKGVIDMQTELLQDSITKASSQFISHSIEPANHIKNHVQNIIHTAEDAANNIFYIIFIGTYILILLLVLILFTAMYYERDCLWIFLLIAIILIIIVALIIYFWATSVKNNAIDTIIEEKDHIKHQCPHIKQAFDSAYECFTCTECTTNDETPLSSF
jgi:hypothetical protein